MEPGEATELFRTAFRLDELTVHETADWTLSVRPGQPVIGSLVLSTRHGALSFSQVPAKARSSLLTLMGESEEAARSMFGAVRMNALCLMMKDPLFHFHLLPRYGAPVDFGGHGWSDSGWPGPPSLAADQALGDADLLALRTSYGDHWRALSG